MNTLKKILAWIENFFYNQRTKAVNDYLSKSTDLADLERRMKEVYQQDSYEKRNYR